MRCLPLLLLSVSACLHAQIVNSAGIRMEVSPGDNDPAIKVTIPGNSAEDRTFKVLFPEHVTVRARSEVKQLYLYRPNGERSTILWKQHKNTLEYERDLSGIRFTARATLMPDGILFHYEFDNRTTTSYEMATAITDPRFRTVFYDPRLERTFIHQKDGFHLLAAETPERLTMPLQQWFPVRYLAQFTAPIPADRLQRRDDGITYRYRSESMDSPMIATLSNDRKWVAASFAKNPGNVWSNPELTCQHVDPEFPLPANGHVEYEVKVLMFQGTLDDAFRKVAAQRNTLK